MRKARLGEQSIEREAARLSTLISGIGGGAAHNILSATHSDASAAAVVQGDLMTGQTGPVWARLALGASGTVLRSDGTDAAWADPASYVPIAPGAQNQMIIANATPAWSLLAAPTAQNQVLLTGASPFTPSWSALFDATVPTTIQCDDAAATGTATVAARRDHKHAIVCDSPDQLVPDNAKVEGTLDSFARSDHGHQITCAAPSANLSVSSSNAEGVSATDFSRSDHSHAITSSSNPGAAASLLASDASGYLQLVGLGIGAAPASADLHFGTGTGITHADGVTAGQFLRANGTRYVPDTLDVADLTDLAYATPAFTYGTANAAGSADSVVRSDATLAIFDATNPTTIAVGDTAAPGSAGVASRRDHTHGITTSSNPGAAASILASDASGHLIVDGLGVGTEYTDGTLHVHTSSAGTVAAASDGDDLVIEATAVVGISLLTGDTQVGSLIWGFPADEKYHMIRAFGSTHASNADKMVLFVANANRVWIDGNGYLHPDITNTQDLGLTGKRWRTAYIGTSIVLSDGATVGQAAGPLLTFDDTNNELEITGCNIGIGAAPGVNTNLLIQDTTIAPTGDYTGIYAQHTVTDASGATAEMRGIVAEVRINDSGESVDEVLGLKGDAQIVNGTCINVYGCFGYGTVASGGTATKVYGGYIGGTTQAGATVTTLYGLFIAAYDVASVSGTSYSLYIDETSMDYGIYQDGTGINYFGGVGQFAAGLRTKVSTNNVSSPPTDAELDTAFGTPATVGEGFIGIVDDNNAETDVWLCVAIGSTWWYEALTKAV